MGYPEEGLDEGYGPVHFDEFGSKYVVINGQRNYDLVRGEKNKSSGFTTYEGNCCGLCGSPTCRGSCFKQIDRRRSDWKENMLKDMYISDNDKAKIAEYSGGEVISLEEMEVESPCILEKIENLLIIARKVAKLDKLPQTVGGN